MNRVRYRGESFIVERRRQANLAEILPATPAKFSGAALVNLLRSLPKPDEQYLAMVEELLTKQPTVAESGMATLIDSSVLIAAERGQISFG